MRILDFIPDPVKKVVKGATAAGTGSAIAFNALGDPAELSAQELEKVTQVRPAVFVLPKGSPELSNKITRTGLKRLATPPKTNTDPNKKKTDPNKKTNSENTNTKKEAASVSDLIDNLSTVGPKTDSVSGLIEDLSTVNENETAYEVELDKLIFHGTKAGILKGQQDFQVRRFNPKTNRVEIQDDTEALLAYQEDFKRRSRLAFADLIHLDKFLVTLKEARDGDLKFGFKGGGIRNDQIETLVNAPDLKKSYAASLNINSGIEKNIDPTEMRAGIDRILRRHSLVSK